MPRPGDINASYGRSGHDASGTTARRPRTVTATVYQRCACGRPRPCSGGCSDSCSGSLGGGFLAWHRCRRRRAHIGGSAPLQLQLHLQCRRRRTCVVHLRCGRIFAEVQPQPGHVHLLDALRLLARRQCGRCRQGVRLRHLLTCHTRGRRRTTMRATGSGSLSRLLAPRGALAARAHRRSRRAQYRSDHIHGARLRLSRHAAPRPAPRPPPPGTGRIRGPRARRPRPATLRRLPHGGLCRALCMWRADTCHFNCMDSTEPQP